jgi:hypothetical protein
MISINENALAAGQGARKTFGLARHSKPYSEYQVNLKPYFINWKVATLLSHALHSETPDGSAAATGAQLVLLLRKNRITADELEFSIREGGAL